MHDGIQSVVSKCRCVFANSGHTGHTCLIFPNSLRSLCHVCPWQWYICSRQKIPCMPNHNQPHGARMNRRNFIAALTSTPIIARHLTSAATAQAGPGTRLGSIGVQLYTVRSLMEKSIGGTLSSVAAIGYKEVEFAGYFNHTPAQIRGMLGDNALEAPATHVGFEADADKWQEVVERSASIGHQWVVVPGIDQSNLKTVDDWKRVAASFNHAAQVCKQSGLGFAYHNHQSEFVSLGGRTPYDVLLKECDAELVKLEMDLAWATVAGQDPAAYFTKYPGRFPLVHVKDIRKNDAKKSKAKDAKKSEDDVLEDVGSGSINWKRILGAAEKNGTVHFIVEHDNPADPLKSIKKSLDYLNALTL
jgi:sugar phosphate isomerase/epimerase